MNDQKVSGCSAIVAGTGSYLPEKILTNDDLAKIVDTNNEWITTRTGISVRHIAADDQTTATLALNAARNAMDAAGITAEQLDLIIVGTITPEMVFPSTACFLQAELGATNAWAFDLSAACSGFVYGLSIAEQFIRSGKYEHALVIGAETLSKITNYEDRGSCILFGDGAGAAVLKRDPEPGKGVIYSTNHADGTGWTSLNCKAYGSRYPASKPLEDPSMIYMHLNGREVYQMAIRRIVETVNDCMEKCNLTIDDIDFLIPHQMNARIIESSAKRLNMPDDKVFINIDQTGNTSAASIPIALDHSVRSGLVKPGSTVITVAFGAGLTWGANVIKF